jgi:hypothetical protein
MFEDDRMPAVNFAPVMKQLIDAAKAQHEAIDILFAMVIEASRQDDPPFFPSQSGKPWAALQQARRAVWTAEAFLKETNDEADIEDAARTKMRAILTATANALKGPPGPLAQHSWHDLPELAARLRDEAHMRVMIDGDRNDA